MTNEELNRIKRLLPCYEPAMAAPEGLSLDDQKDMFYKMSLIRAFEFKIKDLWRANKIRGLCHAYYYAEAIGVGACAALGPGDYITSNHRGHGHMLARGASPRHMMAELFGRQEGYNRGKGGSMHIADIGTGILGATGIVGSGIPTATGAALSAKLQRDGKVSLCFFGDGGSNQGVFAECLNIAAAWSLPVIFLCENNQWGIGTDIHRVTNQPDLYRRAEAFGLQGEAVDGFNVFAVYRAVRKAVDRARAGEGPTLIEAKYMRMLGHHVGDDQAYRDTSDIQILYQVEPLLRMRDYLAGAGIPESELERIGQTAEEVVAQAVDFAENQCTEPPLSALYEDIYANGETIA